MSNTTTKPSKSERKVGVSFWHVLTFIVVMVLIRVFVAQMYFIPSGSMEPTLHGCDGCTGDRILVSPLPYVVGSPERGDIIVFNATPDFKPGLDVVSGQGTSVASSVLTTLGLREEGEVDFVKRVVAVEGDVIECCDASNRISVNGVPQNEKYLGSQNLAVFEPITVPKGRVFVMGDNRSFSADSTAHLSNGFDGTISVSDVRGKAFFRVFPFERFSYLPTINR